MSFLDDIGDGDVNELDTFMYAQMEDRVKISREELYKLVVDVDITIVKEDNRILNKIHFFNFTTFREICEKYALYIMNREEIYIENTEELVEEIVDIITEGSCIGKEHKCLDCQDASSVGHLTCLKYLHKKGKPLTGACRLVALYPADNYRSECLKYAHKNGDVLNAEICEHAARNGNLELLEYLHENGCPWDEKTVTAATIYDKFECLKYACEHGCPVIRYICLYAASGDRRSGAGTCRIIDCLKYLHEKGYECKAGVAAAAAGTGNLEGLKYLHENDCPWDEDACSSAAESGQLACLKYLHEKGCPWRVDICRDAAMGDRSECLKYLHENGCTWDDNTVHLANDRGRVNCLQYMYQSGCPCAAMYIRLSYPHLLRDEYGMTAIDRLDRNNGILEVRRGEID
jgi:hypothetical protein